MEIVRFLITWSDESFDTGEVSYKVSVLGPSNDATLKVAVVDAMGKVVASGSGQQGSLSIPSVKLWWPYTMSGKNFTDMYKFQVVMTFLLI